MEVHMSRLARLSIILSALAVASACTDRTPGPTGLGITASRNGAPFSAGLASPAWQAMAAARFIGPTPPTGSLNPLQSAHAYARSEEHTSELQSRYVISYAVFCLK